MSDKTIIGLAGNPNCGKTTLFNELTGSNGYVGNWPGVTVEKKQATWRVDKNVTFVDLPGIYSLSPYSPEETVSRDYIVNERPDAIINLLDVTNLERNLYLTTQVLEAGRPVVVGLNMIDLLKERGDVIDTKVLSEKLGVPVVEVSALHNTNVTELVQAAIEAGKKDIPAQGPKCFSPEVETALTKIAELIADVAPAALSRWYSIKVFERDASAIAPLGLSAEKSAQLEKVISAVEKSRDDDAESIITSDRYEWIAMVMEAAVKKAPKKLTRSEKIDRIVTNRILGLPIFIAVMTLVYFLAISTVGTAATDWVNDNLFGEGFHVFGIGDAEYKAAKAEFDEHHYGDTIDAYLDAAKEAGIDTDAAQAAVEAKEWDSEDIANFIEEASKKNVIATTTPLHDEDGNLIDTDDNPVRLDADGNPILAEGQVLKTAGGVTADGFKTAIEGSADEPEASSYGIWSPSIPDVVKGALESAGASPVVVGLIIDGIIGGVGSVLGFIPQMLVFFVLLSFLEDCGYMSRVAFVMDRVFRRFGLSGKSFIPLLISSGCGVPGVLSTRTIENEKDRRMTAMLTTMIPCSAKQPIIALVMGVLIGGSSNWWVAPMFYFMGVAAIIVSAIMLKKTKPFSGEPAPFVMELPDYHWPSIRSWAMHVWERISAYIVKAGTIIFAAAVGVWALSNFGWATWDGGTGAFGFLPGFDGAPGDAMEYSLLKYIGEAVGVIFAPLGFSNWQSASASISALIAKENLVSTFGVLYGLGEASEKSVNMWSAFGNMFTDAGGVLHVGAMCAFVAFNMLDAPCFAAIGTIRRQMDSPKWFWFAIGYQCIFAWVVGLIINQLWELFVLGTFGVWTVIAFVLLAGILFQLFRPTPKWDKKDDKILSSLNVASAK